MQGGITANPRASGRFQALIRISAQNDGDMRGWFHLVSGFSAETNPPTCRAFAKKRLKGFEPSTFCMATTLASTDSRATTSRFAGDLRAVQPTPAAVDTRGCAAMCGDVRRCAAMCGDVRRFGHFWPEVPETASRGSNV